jgi:hypothetical protein
MSLFPSYPPGTDGILIEASSPLIRDAHIDPSDACIEFTFHPFPHTPLCPLLCEHGSLSLVTFASEWDASRDLGYGPDQMERDVREGEIDEALIDDPEPGDSDEVIEEKIEYRADAFARRIGKCGGVMSSAQLPHNPLRGLNHCIIHLISHSSLVPSRGTPYPSPSSRTTSRGTPYPSPSSRTTSRGTPYPSPSSRTTSHGMSHQSEPEEKMNGREEGMTHSCPACCYSCPERYYPCASAALYRDEGRDPEIKVMDVRVKHVPIHPLSLSMTESIIMMGLHARCGRMSLLRHLDSSLLRLVLSFSRSIFLPLPGSGDSIARNGRGQEIRRGSCYFSIVTLFSDVQVELATDGLVYSESWTYRESLAAPLLTFICDSFPLSDELNNPHLRAVAEGAMDRWERIFSLMNERIQHLSKPMKPEMKERYEDASSMPSPVCSVSFGKVLNWMENELRSLCDEEVMEVLETAADAIYEVYSSSPDVALLEEHCEG